MASCCCPSPTTVISSIGISLLLQLLSLSLSLTSSSSVHAFVVVHHHCPQERRQQCLRNNNNNNNNDGRRRQEGRRRLKSPALLLSPRIGFELPLLDVLDLSNSDSMFVQPLPSTHLPDEMTTLNVYGMELALPIHQAIIQAALDERLVTPREFDGRVETGCFGHVAFKNNDASSSYVGAIGCAAEILMPPSAFQDPNDYPDASIASDGGAGVQRLLCRGTYRFVVRQIKQSFPFPIAIVDELIDDPITSDDMQTIETSSLGDDDDDDDDDDDLLFDTYAHLTPTQVEQRLMQAMKDHVDQQLTLGEQEKSPLEQSLVEEATGGMEGIGIQQQAAQEMAAVFAVFSQYLLDSPTPSDRYFAVAFMAAEMANMKNLFRCEILQMTNSVQRLRSVLLQLEQMNGMTRARQMANSIAASQQDESEQDLKLGKVEMPPWAMGIKKGTVLEYFWNEEFEWCRGTVIQDPVLVSMIGAADDEILLTLFFDDDGSTHEIPFRADEKARWRPPRR